MDYDTFLLHAGCHVEVVTYADAAGRVVNVALECWDHSVLICDIGKDDDEEGQVAV